MRIEGMLALPGETYFFFAGVRIDWLFYTDNNIL
jgi:hypothetical protein